MTADKGIAMGCTVLSFLVIVCGGGGGAAYVAISKQNPFAMANTKRTDTPPAPPTESTAPPETKQETPPAPPPPPPEPVKPAPARPDPGKVPPQNQLEDMVTSLLLEMDRAGKTGDVKALQERMSGYQGKRGGEELLKFLRFLKIDYSVIQGSAPIFSQPPKIDEEGTLVLEGSYQTSPKISFNFKFVFERGDWRLGSHSISSGG
jgi:hypothetical protein